MFKSNPQNPRPYLAEPGWPAESPAGAVATSRKCGVLVVDDQACLRDILGIGLRQEGFAVWLAANGRQAFDLYQCHHETIDVVLMDVCMPGLDGPKTLVALQELNPQIRCCFISGSLDDYTADRLRKLGAVAVLRKPIHLAEVARVLREQARRVPWSIRIAAERQSICFSRSEPYNESVNITSKSSDD